MIVKPKLYKIALVATAIVLMLVSTAGAFPYCGCGCVPHSGAHTYTDESSDSSDNKCIVCPTCPTCPACNCPTCPACNCPTCAAPALNINKTANLTNYYASGQVIGYNYTLTNTGNVALSGIVIYDNITSPTGMPVTTITTLDPGVSITVPATYTTTSNDVNNGFVTNSAYATAIGNLINIISNIVSTTVSVQQYPA